MEGHSCRRMKSLVERGVKSEGKVVITLSQTAFQTNLTSAVCQTQLEKHHRGQDQS